MKIAVLLDETGMTSSFSEKATLYIYERKDDVWTAYCKLGWEPAPSATMEELRMRISQVADWLGDCKVVVAESANGFYRIVFGSFDIALWALSGEPKNYISHIEKFYESAGNNESSEEDKAGDLITPVEGIAGHYHVDLRQVMAHNTRFNSRDVLLPFLEAGTFRQLEIVCDHEPRWFKEELSKRGLRSATESHGFWVKIHVYGA